MSTTANWRRALHWALVVIGVATVIYGAVWMSRGAVTCRGVEMAPGDVCHRNSYTELNTDQTQSYAQRKAAMRQSQPTVIGAGAVLALFGVMLLRRQGSGLSEDEQRLLSHH